MYIALGPSSLKIVHREGRVKRYLSSHEINGLPLAVQPVAPTAYVLRCDAVVEMWWELALESVATDRESAMRATPETHYDAPTLHDIEGCIERSGKHSSKEPDHQRLCDIHSPCFWLRQRLLHLGEVVSHTRVCHIGGR